MQLAEAYVTAQVTMKAKMKADRLARLPWGAGTWAAQAGQTRAAQAGQM
jgi:hypothetical protein